MVKFNTEVQVTEEQVLAMMAAAGLEIGSMVTSKVGEGEIIGFEVNEVAGDVGVLVCFMVGDVEKKVMANKVKPMGAPSESAPAAVAEVVEEEAVDSAEADSLAAEIARLSGQAKDKVDRTINVDGRTLTVSHNMSEEEQAFEAGEAENKARIEEWKNRQFANARSAAKSEAAQRIMEQANKLIKGGGAAQAPANKPASSNGNNGRRPGAGQQQQTQTRGGNVNMANNNQTQVRQDAPARGTAGNGRRETAAQVPAVRNNNNAGRRPAGNAPAGGRTRLGAGAPVAGNNSTATRRGGAAVGQRQGGTRLRTDSPVSNGYFQGAWFMNEDRYPLAVTGAEIFESRENLQLGITNINIYDTVELAESRGYEARDNDYFTIVVHFGPAVNFEFTIKLSSNENAKTPFYCSNVSLIKRKDGSSRWQYITNRRKDAAMLVHDTKKDVLRHATNAEINSEKQTVKIMEIANSQWTQETIYGMYMSEEVIAQVMRLAQYAWDFENGMVEVEAEVVE